MELKNVKVTIGGVEVSTSFEPFEPIMSPVEFAVFSIDPLKVEESNKNKQVQFLAFALKSNKQVQFLAFALKYIYELAKKYQDRKKLDTLKQAFQALHSLLEDEGVSVTTEAKQYFTQITKGV